MSVSDAVILLVADGLVAVGRVLRGLRRPSGAEVRAQAVGEADRLSEREAVIDSWEPDELWVPDGPSAFVWPESVGPKHGLTCRSCEGDIATCGCWDDDADESNPVRSAAVSPPAADNTTDCGCGSGSKCPDPITCPDAVTAAMDADTAAADGTDLYDAIVALWDYHGVDTSWDDEHPWGCQGCEWKGDYQREHTLHRLALVADMKAATHRIQEQLGGAS